MTTENRRLWPWVVGAVLVLALAAIAGLRGQEEAAVLITFSVVGIVGAFAWLARLGKGAQ